MTTLPKADLAKFIADRTLVPKGHVVAVLEALGPVIQTNCANGHTVALPGLGRFGMKDRAARTGRNPRTGEAVEIPAARVLTFKLSKPSKS